jgi:hypothetical protein
VPPHFVTDSADDLIRFGRSEDVTPHQHGTRNNTKQHTTELTRFGALSSLITPCAVAFTSRP